MIQVKADNLAKEKQLAEKLEEDHPHPDAMDTDMDFDSSHMDVSLSLDDTTMVEANHGHQKQGLNTDNIDEEDMEELLQIQRDRLDRLKKVIVLGMDADTVKANGRNGDKEDLLF